MNMRVWIMVGLAGIVTIGLLSCAAQSIPDGGDTDGGTDDGTTDGGGGTGDPFVDYTPDPNIFVATPDPAMITELATDDGGSIEFAINIVLVLMEEDAVQEDVDEVVAELDGTIVGQVPEVGLYQIQVTTSTLEALDTAIATAEANVNVAYAGYDVAPTLAQECPADNDNRNILQLDQCPFAETEYFQALTMFDIFRPHLLLDRVTVGVVDTGLDPTTGEFDDVNVLFLNNIAGPPTDSDSDLHGTGTCGIIAADDDGNGVNGMASRFLGSRLNLVVGAMNHTAAGSIAYTVMACAAGADVVNLSLGWEETHEQFEVIWHSWLRTLGQRGDVLFVVAAGNETRELDGLNYAPGGIDLPNVMTVASTASCNPQSVAGFSNHGTVVDIAAPGDRMPVVRSGGLYAPLSGTSLSAPIVTSLAAILKSIEPGLYPRQIARYITERSLPINLETPFGRAVFSNSITQLLIETNVGDPVQSWIDPMGLGVHGASGLVLSRICPQGISYQIDSYGAHSLRRPEDDVGLGAIGSVGVPPTVSITGHTDEVVFTVGSSTLTEFALGTYPLVKEPGPDSGTASFVEMDSLDGGVAIAGTLTLDSCRIDQRDPFTGLDPWIVVVSGTFEGVFEVGQFGEIYPTLHDFNGDFNLPMAVANVDDLHDYLEATCEGGLPREEGSTGSDEATE
jgi:subtilisin family serine protease